MEKEIFEELLSSAKQARQIIDGKQKPSRRFAFKEPNAKEIRTKMSLSQANFAKMLNISVHTLRNWEQGRRQPQGPAKVLLNIAEQNPQVFIASAS